MEIEVLAGMFLLTEAEAALFGFLPFIAKYSPCLTKAHWRPLSAQLSLQIVFSVIVKIGPGQQIIACLARCHVKYPYFKIRRKFVDIRPTAGSKLSEEVFQTIYLYLFPQLLRFNLENDPWSFFLLLSLCISFHLFQVLVSGAR